jgi:uncharacterized integral membrane protein
MNKVYFVLSLILLIGVTIFALMNTKAVTVHLFWVTDLKAPIAAVILGSVALGAVLMALFDLGRHIQLWRELRGLRGNLKATEEELKVLRIKKAETNSSAGQTESTAG